MFRLESYTKDFGCILNYEQTEVAKSAFSTMLCSYLCALNSATQSVNHTYILQTIYMANQRKIQYILLYYT